MKKILLALGVLVGLVVLGAGGLMGYASYKLGKKYDVPLPKITRATSPEALARGEQIYRSVCGECHAGPGGTRPVGVHLKEFPAPLGKFYSANLTSHPEAGIGAQTDEELARMIINGIDRHGNARPMPYFKDMGDADIAAVIGFMRSSHPDFEPSPQKQPLSELTTLGKLVFAVAMGVNDQPRLSEVPVPPKAVTVEYGKYLASAVYDCVGCHTAGYTSPAAKMGDPNAFAGGFEYDLSMIGGEGKIYSSNLTPDELVGIGKWSLEEFKRAMREGIVVGGFVMRPPMPRYRYMGDMDLEAIYTYLKSLPPNPKAVPLPTTPRPEVEPAASPEKLFSSLGCVSCHGPNKDFADRLKNAAGKPVTEVAKWIRNPESFKPGTMMPTYATLLDDGQALELARWVQQKGATP
jgi:mono/diheme cytochrome c family protein